MTTTIAPLLPLSLIIALGVCGLAIVAVMMLARQRGAVLRGLALAALLAAMLNPVVRHETRRPETDIAVIVTDMSDSQKIGQRTERPPPRAPRSRRASPRTRRLRCATSNWPATRTAR